MASLAKAKPCPNLSGLRSGSRLSIHRGSIKKITKLQKKTGLRINIAAGHKPLFDIIDFFPTACLLIGEMRGFGFLA
jgi:hypothetical protein